MKIIVLISISILAASCADTNFLSADKIIEQNYSQERLEGNGAESMLWVLHEIIGAEGPYQLSTDMPIQSNSGESIEFSISENGMNIEKRFNPETENIFYLGVPVTNENGNKSMIVLRSEIVQQKN